MWFDAYSNEYLEEAGIIERLCGMKNGVVLLQGPTMCGKTRLIRALQAADPRSLHAYTVENIRDVYYMPKNGFDDSALVNADKTWQIICFEDIDLFKSSEFMMSNTAYLVNQLSANALVILTGIECEERIPSLLSEIRSPIRKIVYAQAENS